jgi:pimeloyl-ACP methyl ester carboxylesterase
MTDQLARARAEIAKHDGPVVLIGHSFGGKAALALAKEMPDKVKGVIAIAPSVKMLYAYWKNLTGERGLPESRETIIARLAEHEETLRGKLATAGDDKLKARKLRGELGYLKTMQDLALHDETNMELDVGVPVLMLHGTDDESVSIHYAHRFAEANPKVKLVEYPGLGHGMDAADKELGRAAREKLEREAHKDMSVRIHGFLKELEAK